MNRISRICIAAATILGLVNFSDIAFAKILNPVPDACPIISFVIPEKVIASHDSEILTKILSGGSKERWQSLIDDKIILHFSHDTVIRRIGIGIRPVTSKSSAGEIQILWRPQENTWPSVTNEIKVGTLFTQQCFFLGYHADIPENVPLSELELRIPKGVEIVSLSLSAHPSDQQSVSCPSPEFFEEVNRAFQNAKSSPADKILVDNFVGKFARLLPRYDCRRSQDYEPVPAWWLCGNGSYAGSCSDTDLDQWMAFLSKFPCPEAKRLFASQDFRRTLDGEVAESYLSLSEKAAKELERK